MSRDVLWGDLQNAWDLGGLPTATGITQPGRVFRSMSPDALDADGWADVVAAGIQTIVDLRNDNEVTVATSRPESLIPLRRPIEDQNDEGFMAEWGARLGSPGYYSEVLRRWPVLITAAFAAIADASGPLLFHCGAGRDRTGMIAAMLFSLAGTERAAILDDYEASARAYGAWLATHPGREKPRFGAELDAAIAASRAELSLFLDEVDVESYLLAEGLSGDQLERLRTILL